MTFRTKSSTLVEDNVFLAINASFATWKVSLNEASFRLEACEQVADDWEIAEEAITDVVATDWVVVAFDVKRFVIEGAALQQIQI